MALGGVAVGGIGGIGVIVDVHTGAPPRRRCALLPWEALREAWPSPETETGGD